MSIYHIYYEKMNKTASHEIPDRALVFPTDDDQAERIANIIAAQIIAKETKKNLVLLDDADPVMATTIRNGSAIILQKGGAVVLGEYTMRIVAIDPSDYKLEHYDWTPVDENAKIEGKIDLTKLQVSNVSVIQIDEDDEDTEKRHAIVLFYANIPGSEIYYEARICKIPKIGPVLSN